MKKILRVIVTMEMPEDSTVAECLEYVDTAVRCEAGLRDPKEDPMFYFNRDSLKVRQLFKITKE